MKKVFGMLTVMLLIFVITGTSNAALVSINDPGFGPGSITRDTETNIDWLDVTISTNYSYNQIVTQTQPGGIFEAYDLASATEVRELWTNAGINLDTWNVFTSNNYAPIVNLQSFIGITGNIGTNTDLTWGIVQPQGGHPFVSIELYADHDTATALISPDYNPAPDTIDGTMGAYLKKSAPVPIPGAIWLLGSGLIGLVGVRRKFRKS